MWTSPRDPSALERTMEDNDHLDWVQLPFAGIEKFVHLVDDNRQWTCAKGVYAEPVAELALTLALAGMRGVGHYSRQRTWTRPRGTNLHGANVTILGGGGITESLIRLLVPFGCRITVTLLHEMRRRKARKGLSMLCIGVGQGLATAWEAV